MMNGDDKMIACKWCGEPIMSHQHSKRDGMCNDCYGAMDMDRFTEYDKAPTIGADKKCSYRVFDPSTGQYVTPERTSPLAPHHWRKILDNPANVVIEDLVSLVLEDRRQQVGQPPVSGSGVRTGDK